MINDNRSDEEIIKRVLVGEIESYKIIVERYENKIFSIGMRFFKNRDDSYDFTQEIFLKAYENLRSYRGSAPFRYWLTKIAYNHGINKINSLKNEPEIAEKKIVSEEISPEGSHIRNEVKRVLIDAIDKLPEQYKICLDFYFFLGLRYNEISEITGYPVNTIKSHVLRAKNILRNTLKGTVAEEYYEM